MIILRRNKKIIELYPIGSAKGALNNQRKPLFYSYFKLHEDNGKIRPQRFIIKQDNVETLKSPKDVIRTLRKQNVLLATEDEEIEDNIEEGYIIYNATVEGKTEIIPWIMGMGTACTVLEPLELKKDIIKAYKDVLNNYK